MAEEFFDHLKARHAAQGDPGRPRELNILGDFLTFREGAVQHSIRGWAPLRAEDDDSPDEKVPNQWPAVKPREPMIEDLEDLRRESKFEWPNVLEPAAETDAPMNTPMSVILKDEAGAKADPEPKVELLPINNTANLIEWKRLVQFDSPAAQEKAHEFVGKL